MTFISYEITDWSKIEAVRYEGETGYALWKTVQTGDLRVRIVEMSAGYLADHWCTKGHLVFVLEGEMFSELKDGETEKMTTEFSYLVSDEMSCHRTHAPNGAKVLIVDGGFLKAKE